MVKNVVFLWLGFNNTDYLLEKWVKVLTDGGFTVPVWYEYKSVGKKKERKLLQIFSPGCFFCDE